MGRLLICTTNFRSGKSILELSLFETVSGYSGHVGRRSKADYDPGKDICYETAQFPGIAHQ
jgi:hypothetical protein